MKLAEGGCRALAHERILILKRSNEGGHCRCSFLAELTEASSGQATNIRGGIAKKLHKSGQH
jgi:hypothetical protein